MTNDPRTHAPVADPRYPVGRFQQPVTIDALALEEALQTLGELPQNLRAAVDGLLAKYPPEAVTVAS